MRKDKKVIGICVASMQSDSWEKHVRAICKEAGKRDYTVMIFNTFQRLYEVTKFGEGEVRVFDMIPFHKLGVLIVRLQMMRYQNSWYKKQKMPVCLLLR